MSNITSVSKGFEPPNRKPGVAVTCIGFLLVLICASLQNTTLIVTSALLMIIGIVLIFNAKPTYTVKVGSASGEVSALKSKDEKYIQSIVQAMNEAIIKRG